MVPITPADLDSLLAEGVEYRGKWDQNWNRRYDDLKMRFWRTQKRADWRPKVEFPGAFVNTIKEIGIISQGKYKINAEPSFPSKLAETQSVLLGNYAANRWEQDNMPVKLLEVVWDQAWTGCGITKSVLSLASKQIETTIVRPDDIFVSPGTVEFDETCMWVIHRVRVSADTARDIIGEYTANQAEGAGGIELGNSSDVTRNDFHIMINRDTGAVDFLNGTTPVGRYEDVFIDEFWLRDGPDIRRITRIGQVIVDDVVFLIDEFPFIRWPGHPIPHEFWGVPTCQPYANINIAMNQLVSYMLDYFIANTYQKFVVSRDVKLDFENMENSPNGLWTVDGPPQQAVMPIAPAQLNGQIFGMFGQLGRMMQDASFAEVQFGRATGANKTALQTQMLLAANQTNVNLKAELLGRSASKWVRLMWKMDSAYAVEVEGTPERLIRLTGANNDDPIEAQKLLAALGMAVEEKPLVSVKFDFVSGLPMTREARKQEALLLFQNKAIDQQDLLETFGWPSRQRYIDQQEAMAAGPAPGALPQGQQPPGPSMKVTGGTPVEAGQTGAAPLAESRGVA